MLIYRFGGDDDKDPTEKYLEKYRLAFGDENVLDFYLDLLAQDEKGHDWTSDALRLVGNSCADLGSYANEILQATVTDQALRHQ